MAALAMTAIPASAAEADSGKISAGRVPAVTAFAADITGMREGRLALLCDDSRQTPEEYGLERLMADARDAHPDKAEPEKKPETKPEASKLTPAKGVNYGPSGKETWYDLDMSGCIELMNALGYSSEDYPYWVREDGCKMFGDYVMVAADLELRPKGTILECSLGTAIVVDTGRLEKRQLDIAVDWED